MKQASWFSSAVRGGGIPAVFALAFSLSCGAMADDQLLPTAATAPLQKIEAVQKVTMPVLDMVKIEQEDEANFLAGMPPRYAKVNPAQYTPLNSGTWEALGDGQSSVWRLRIECTNAVSINLGFTRYVMPEGGRLYLYSPDFASLIRPFTASDNMEHHQLWTPPVEGNSLVVELTIPTREIANLELVLGSINCGYRPFAGVGKAGGGGVDSGSCNVDVVCAQGAPWAAEIPCVGNLSIGGSFFCTGFLVNNTAQDYKPYLMTANHCGIGSGNAPSLVVYWNYQNSFCRTPGSAQSGQPGNGSLATFSTGSVWRAGSSTASDFTLVELNQQPNPAWLLSWAGWDRTGIQSPNGACIHHPNNDEKRITFYTSSTDNNSCGFTGPHVRAFWSLGVTEPGSSGSPLFDTNHRVIGQLHGGPSACGASQLWDCYGRFSSSWTGGGTNSTRLSNWLDPGNTGATTLNTLQIVPAPQNDSCVNATTVGLGSTSFTNVGASTDGPNEPSGCVINGYAQIGNDVWYKFIATCTGTATVSLCGANFDTKMAAYGACPGASGQFLACNDDFCNLASQISFPVTQGTIYRIRIGGYQGATGSGTMTISCAAPQCPTDINHDNVVNVTDLLAVINNWGGGAGNPADVNGDNQVNVSDLLLVINTWGNCP